MVRNQRDARQLGAEPELSAADLAARVGSVPASKSLESSETGLNGTRLVPRGNKGAGLLSLTP